MFFNQPDLYTLNIYMHFFNNRFTLIWYFAAKIPICWPNGWSLYFRIFSFSNSRLDNIRINHHLLPRFFFLRFSLPVLYTFLQWCSEYTKSNFFETYNNNMIIHFKPNIIFLFNIIQFIIISFYCKYFMISSWI